jgi:hypothetical protein
LTHAFKSICFIRSNTQRLNNPFLALRRGDAEVDEVWLLAGADDDVVLALQVAVRDAGRVHRPDRLQQLREEVLAVRELGLLLAQRRAGHVLERQAVADETERARDADDAMEPLVDGLLAAQQRSPHGTERPAAVRLLDDDVADRGAVQPHGRLIAQPKLAAGAGSDGAGDLGRQFRGGPRAVSHGRSRGSEDRVPRDPGSADQRERDE